MTDRQTDRQTDIQTDKHTHTKSVAFTAYADQGLYPHKIMFYPSSGLSTWHFTEQDV